MISVKLTGTFVPKDKWKDEFVHSVEGFGDSEKAAHQDAMDALKILESMWDGKFKLQGTDHALS